MIANILNSKDAGGTGDKIEQFGWFRSMKGQKFPSSLTPFMDELADYSKRMHAGVLHKLLACECASSLTGNFQFRPG